MVALWHLHSSRENRQFSVTSAREQSKETSWYSACSTFGAGRAEYIGVRVGVGGTGAVFKHGEK